MSETGERTRRPPAAPPDDADRATLDRVAGGQVEALEALYDRYRTMAYSIAFRITNDAALAQDVVQDGFVSVWRNAGRHVEGRGTVKTWLLAIVHHAAVDAVRRRRSASELADRDDVPPATIPLPDVWPEVAGRLLRLEILSALRTLSDVQREAIVLAYFGGLTQQEIAKKTSTSVATVKSRMRLGLLAMRRALLGASAGTPEVEATLWADQ